jgi:hypothetical protein
MLFRNLVFVSGMIGWFSCVQKWSHWYIMAIQAAILPGVWTIHRLKVSKHCHYNNRRKERQSSHFSGGYCNPSQHRRKTQDAAKIRDFTFNEVNRYKKQAG